MENLLQSVYFGNTILQYIKGIGIAIGLAVLLYFVARFINYVTTTVGSKTSNPIISVLLSADKQLNPILQYFPILFLVHYLTLPQKLVDLVGTIWIILLAITVVRYIQNILKVAVRRRSELKGDASNALMLNSVLTLTTALLWILAFLFVISNLGFNISTLLAGLGIGGMALALASQTLLGDLFNYFSIVADKPFNIGDYVEVGGVGGNVVSIGLKGTRLTSISGEQIVISNTEVTKNILKNYKVLEKRRVYNILAIKYETPVEKIKEVPAILKDILNNTSYVDISRVYFSKIGESSLDFEFVYFVTSNDYSIFMKAQEEVNLKVMEAFEKNNIEFAYPTQGIYMLEE